MVAVKFFIVLREHPVYIGGGIVGERVRKHKTHPFSKILAEILLKILTFMFTAHSRQENMASNR